MKSKHFLVYFIAIISLMCLLLNCGPNRKNTTTICTPKGGYTIGKQTMIKLFKIDSDLNKQITDQDEFMFYQGFVENMKDTFVFVVLKPSIKNEQVMFYIQHETEFLFFPARADTCYMLSLSSLKPFEKKNKFPYLIGRMGFLAYD